MARDVGLDRLGKRQRDGRAVLGRAQQQFVIGVADVASFEQDGRRIGAAKHMESGEAVRVWTHVEPARRLVDEAGGEVGRLSQPVIDRMLAESGPGESKTCDDVFAAMVRLVDARDSSYRDL